VDGRDLAGRKEERVSEEDERVSIRAHYERFPATVKGAFVLRGSDRDPHLVAIREARLVEASGGGAQPIGLASAVIDVAPHRDFFVPFEFAIAELEAGWYRLECEVDIDGSPAVMHPGKAFSVSWPRGTTRRGTLSIDRAVAADRGPKVQLEQVELTADAMRLQYAAEEPVDLRVFADDERLPLVAQEFDDRSGKGRLFTYPALRSHARLRIEVRAAGHPRSRPAEVDLDLP
jgi:hypothetical protein